MEALNKNKRSIFVGFSELRHRTVFEKRMTLLMNFLVYAVLASCPVLDLGGTRIACGAQFGSSVTKRGRLRAAKYAGATAALTRAQENADVASTDDSFTLRGSVGSKGPQSRSGGILGERLTNFRQWERTVISLKNPSYEGNPFELDFEVDFTHLSSGLVLTLPGYFDGGDTWRVGFMPTKVGEWQWVANSSDPDLQDKWGTIIASPSNLHGMLAGHAPHLEKWTFAAGTPVVLIGVFVQVMLDDATDAEFEAMADFMAAHNLTMANFRLSENDRAFSNVAERHMNLALWRRLEARMEILTARNIAVTVMLFTDDSGKPSFPGRSAAEKLLIRYCVARLVGFPGVIFNSGIDISEYRDNGWVDWYGEQVRSLDPYGHPVSSRRGGGSGEHVMAGQTYNSVGDRNSSMSGLLAAYARGDALPAANDDNWSEDLDGINGHTPHDIRRAAWKAVVAGGIGFSVRHNTLYCPGRISECDRYFPIISVDKELDAATWLAMVNPFVRQRLGKTYNEMHPAHELIDTSGGKYALAAASRTRILCLLLGRDDTWDPGEGDAITLELDHIVGQFTASWFDPRSGTERTAGRVTGGAARRLHPPDDQDWILLLERLSDDGDDDGDG